MDAIFVQSYFGEFVGGKNNRGFLFLENLLGALSNSNSLDIILFLGGGDFLLGLDKKNYEIINNIKLSYPSLKIIVVHDSLYTNPTSCVFSFLMNYKLDIYKKILLLETDCFLVDGFDDVINKKISNLLLNDWFIFGSAYYGVSQSHGSSAEHMNGVAVYNRSFHFNGVFSDFLKSSLILDHNSSNYDYCFYKYLVLIDKFKNYCIDSDLILNISTSLDSDLNWKKIKREAVVIHTKNPKLAATFQHG
jgi:hypothetical protein